MQAFDRAASKGCDTTEKRGRLGVLLPDHSVHGEQDLADGLQPGVDSAICIRHMATASMAGNAPMLQFCSKGMSANSWFRLAACLIETPCTAIPLHYSIPPKHGSKAALG